MLLLSWDGRDHELTELEPATHVLTNVGHRYPPVGDTPGDAEAARFSPKFAARRPPGDPAATIMGAWGDWLTLAAGDGLAATEPGAILVHHELPDGRVYGSTSVRLVALAGDGSCVTTSSPPGDPAGPRDLVLGRDSQCLMQSSHYANYPSARHEIG